MLAQNLRDGEHDICGGNAGRDGARELEADDLRDEHRDRLAEHRCLCLDSADAPAEHAEAVDHRGVRVGADTGVGVRLQHSVDLTGHRDARQVLDVDLVDDSGAGRDDLEVVERRLAPAKELVTLAVALVLDVGVALERILGAEQVGDDRVVDDHLGGRERVDLPGVAAEGGDCLTHGREVDDARNTGEVLHDDARRRELDLGIGLGGGVPAAEGVDVVGRDVRAVFGAKQVLEEDLQAERELLVARNGVDSEDFVVRRPDPEGVFCSKAVYRRHVALSFIGRRGKDQPSCSIFVVERSWFPARLT